MEPSIDVVGVGNAIVDVIATVSDDFISQHGLVKSAMTLIDADRATSLYDLMPPGIESSGGSAANTMVGLVSMGGSAAYIGKVRNDQLGEVFRHDLRAAGVDYEVAPGVDGAPTARCLIQVTPDAERTMNTFLGKTVDLAPSDVDEELVSSASVTYCEGYLWDAEVAKAAMTQAMDIAHSAGRTVSLTLSDSFCVDRHRDEWLDLLDDKVDIVFANEAEICSLFQTDSFGMASDEIGKLVEVSALTRAADGSTVVTANETWEVSAARVERVVDATGAGDLYASGFLYGVSHGADLQRCAVLGGLAAAEVISHIGARPRQSLSDLVNMQ